MAGVKRLAHMVLMHPRKASWRQLVNCPLGVLTATDDVTCFVAPFACKIIGGRVAIEDSNATLGSIQLKANTAGTVLSNAASLAGAGDQGDVALVMASTNFELAAGDVVFALYTHDTNSPGYVVVTLDVERLDTSPL